MKRVVKPKKDNSERWLLTYSDLITLLLVFFIVMYAISSADAKKFSRLAGSMRKAFNVGVLEGGPDASILEQSIDPASLTGGKDEEAASTETGDLQMILKEMSGLTQSETLGDKVSVNLRPEGIAISITGSTLFASGRADLRPDAVNILQTVAKVLVTLPNSVRVEGHTDDVTPNGTDYATNWELSSARAVSVVRYLSEVEKIDAKRLSAAAYSEYQPVVPNDSARSRSQNRRSEILILYPPRSTGTASVPAASVAGVSTSVGSKEGTSGVPKE